MNIVFYEITAQVIPVLIVALVLQTRIKSFGQAIYGYAFAFKDDNQSADVIETSIKFIRFFIYLAFIAEITSLSVIFAGGAPWPVSLLIWPGLLSILWLLLAEMSALVEGSIYRTVLSSAKKETDRLKNEANRLKSETDSHGDRLPPPPCSQ